MKSASTKFFTALITILFFLNFVSAQPHSSYEIGEPYKAFKALERYYFTDSIGDKSLSIKCWDNKLYLQSYDNSTLKELSHELIDYLPDNFVVELATWFGGRLLLFYNVWDRKLKTEQLFVQEIDFEKCKFKGDPNRIISHKGKLTGTPSAYFGPFSFGAKEKFFLKFSRDSSKLLVQYKLPPKKVRDNINKDIIGMYVYDSQLNLLHSNDIEMPYTESQLNIFDYAIDHLGTPYIVAKIEGQDDDRKKNNRKPDYHFEVLKVNVENQTSTSIKIRENEFFIIDATIIEQSDESMAVTGFYSIKENSQNADGIFVAQINKDGTAGFQKLHEIPIDIINQYQKGRTQRKNKNKDKKGKAELKNFSLRQSFIDADKNIIIFGEQFAIRESTYRTNNMVQSMTTYIFGAILATKISKTGELIWMTKIPKLQSGSAAYGLSYKNIILNDDYVFIGLDNIKNKELPLDKRPHVYSNNGGGYLTAFQVNSVTGKLRKHYIANVLKTKKGDKLRNFGLNRVFKSSDENFMVEFHKKRKSDVMLKINIK